MGAARRSYVPMLSSGFVAPFFKDNMDFQELKKKLEEHNPEIADGAEQFVKEVEKCARLVADCLELNEITTPTAAAALTILAQLLYKKMEDDPIFQKLRKLAEKT